MLSTPLHATEPVARQVDSSQFDYSSLSPPVSKFLRGQAARIRQYCTKSIIQIGKDLVGAKHYLSHGEFLRWVEDEVGIPARTAQAYMRVANWASSKSATAALLPPTALYALSSSGVPAEFVEGILRRVEDGERIQLSSLRTQIKALRDAIPQHDRRRAVGEMGDQSNSDSIKSCTEAAALISSAVVILARALTVDDFAQVREIITSKPVLHDPNLAMLLERAFESYETAADTRPPNGSLAGWEFSDREPGKLIAFSRD